MRLRGRSQLVWHANNAGRGWTRVKFRRAELSKRRSCDKLLLLVGCPPPAPASVLPRQAPHADAYESDATHVGSCSLCREGGPNQAFEARELCRATAVLLVERGGGAEASSSHPAELIRGGRERRG